MKKQKCLVFGQEVDAGWLSSETVGEVLITAAEHAVLAAEPDIACIVDILDQVADAWADPAYHLRKKAAKLLPELTDRKSVV